MEVTTKTTYERPEVATEDEISSMAEEEMIAKAKEGYFVRNLAKAVCTARKET